ncbi:MAG: hypothetical protein CHACPFDD_04134 [Phycisphaerae bacterium]|nr:hypothetical protein [Phycisphaerae bacterium]
MNDLVHRDLEVDKGDGSVSTMKRYVHGGIGVGRVSNPSLGYGLVAQYGVSGGDTRFFHADLVGTTRMMTDSSGAIQTRLRWTAFGEPLPLVTGEPPYGYEQPSGAETRYGYAGSWGYQNDGLAGNPPSGATLDIGLLHVGARYYDPAIGRFVMRDPIGIGGGVNVYAYCRGAPTIANDATGQSAIIGTVIGFVQQDTNKVHCPCGCRWERADYNLRAHSRPCLHAQLA